MKLRWTRLSIADIGNLLDYISENNPDAAASVVQSVEKAAAILVRHPELGRHGRVAGTRELVVVGTPFVIAYRLQKGSIAILAVIHAARKWPEII